LIAKYHSSTAIAIFVGVLSLISTAMLKDHTNNELSQD
jgi:hypothetical protein